MLSAFIDRNGPNGFASSSRGFTEDMAFFAHVNGTYYVVGRMEEDHSTSDAVPLRSPADA